MGKAPPRRRYTSEWWKRVKGSDYLEEMWPKDSRSRWGIRRGQVSSRAPQLVHDGSFGTKVYPSPTSRGRRLPNSLPAPQLTSRRKFQLCDPVTFC